MTTAKTYQIGQTKITVNPDSSIVSSPANPTQKQSQQAKLTEIGLDQAFRFQCRGLKPLTKHSFIWSGVVLDTSCKQAGKKYGAGLTSDNNGSLNFVFHWAAIIQTIIVNDVVAWERAKSMFISATQAQVTSADGTSVAQFTVQSTLIKCLGDWFHLWEGSAVA